MYKGQELCRLVTMVSYCQYIDTLAAWKDISHYFTETILTFDIPIS